MLMEEIRMPQGGLSAKAAQKVVYSSVSRDSNPQANLASFVTTEMEPEAEQILLDGMKKNFIDLDQYPGSGSVEEKCIEMIGRLWNAPSPTTSTSASGEEEGTTSSNTKICGTSCLGSSEAIMLAGLAMRSKWRARREREGKSTQNPNIVFGSNVQVCWHKMCKYFDIECREADVIADTTNPEQSSLVLTPESARPLIDENTIGVCPILGSTYNGEYEDVKGIHDMVVQLNEEKNWDIPLHIDAASGGFIAPFLTPELVWDFRLPNVKSINASGHKFGLTYAGLGWLVFREEQDLPKDLVFAVSYLGGSQESFTLNFSKPASAILAQYYNFVRLGFEGYKQTMQDCMDCAAYLRSELVKLDRVHIVDKQHMPLVSWSLNPSRNNCTVFELSDRLQKKGGWSVPAYKCSAGAEELDIMRVVVKNSFSMVMCDLLLKDILDAFEYFDQRAAQRLSTTSPPPLSTINEDSIYMSDHEAAEGQSCGSLLLKSTAPITAELLSGLKTSDNTNKLCHSHNKLHENDTKQQITIVLSKEFLIRQFAFIFGLVFGGLASLLLWSSDQCKVISKKAKVMQVYFEESSLEDSVDTENTEEESPESSTSTDHAAESSSSTTEAAESSTEGSSEVPSTNIPSTRPFTCMMSMSMPTISSNTTNPSTSNPSMISTTNPSASRPGSKTRKKDRKELLRTERKSEKLISRKLGRYSASTTQSTQSTTASTTTPTELISGGDDFTSEEELESAHVLAGIIQRRAVREAVREKLETIGNCVV